MGRGWRKERRYFDKENIIEFEEGKVYTDTELNQMAEQMLRAHSRSFDPITGKRVGTRGGKAPILFPEHLDERHRRELTNQNGIPDPSIEEGFYWRPTEGGRKVNSLSQRRSGSGWFR